MKRFIKFLPLLLALTLEAPAQAADANPPERMTYQGFLVDGNGIALGQTAPKNYDVIFRIWNDQTAAGAGNRLWTEQQTVTVDKGYFSVLLGEGTSTGEARPSLSTVFSGTDASDRYVGITVKGIGPSGTDVDIQPRLRMLTSPYSYLARRAVSIAAAGTLVSSNFDSTIGLWSSIGNNIFRTNGAVGINTSNPNTGVALHVAGKMYVSDGTSTLPDVGTFGSAGTRLVLWPGTNNTAPYALGIEPGGMWFGTPANTMQKWYEGTTARMTLAGANLGIGTYPSISYARLQVAGSIMPAYGNSSSAGIMFPPDPGGGGGDNAWMRYYARSGESSTLELGIGNDGDDHIALMPSGNVGVGTLTPTAKLHVAGDIKSDGNISSPKFKVTDVLPVLTGNWNNRLGTFTSSGGTLVLTISLTGYAGSANTTYFPLLSFDNGANVGITSFYFNQTGVHHSLPVRTMILPGVAAGTHTIRLLANGMAVDANDVSQVTVTEYPF